MCCLLHGNGAGLSARATEYSHLSSYATLASPLALPGQPCYHLDDMAITPWQPTLDAVASLLKRRPHGDVLEQVIVDSRTSHR